MGVKVKKRHLLKQGNGTIGTYYTLFFGNVHVWRILKFSEIKLQRHQQMALTTHDIKKTGRYIGENDMEGSKGKIKGS